MSYQIEVILTDGRKVREVYGSNNAELLNLISDQDYEEYDYFLEANFDCSSDELSSRVLMRKIIEGTTEDRYTHLLLNADHENFGISTLGAVYGYLERDICMAYGHVINRNADGWPMLTAYMDEFESRNRSFFKRPYSLDFPHTFCILTEELNEYKKMYVDKLKARYPDNGDLQDDLDFIFGEAKKSGLDIYLCNY